MCSAPAPRTRRHGVEEADDADEVERDGAAAERVQLRVVDGLLQLGVEDGLLDACALERRGARDRVDAVLDDAVAVIQYLRGGHACCLICLAAGGRCLLGTG